MITVPLSNPIRFRPITGQTDVNFDNQFADDFTGQPRPFAQLVADDEWQVQVVTDYNTFDETGYCDIKIIEKIIGIDTVVGDNPSVYQVDGLYYHTFIVQPITSGCIKLYVLLNGDTIYTHESEWLENIGDADDYRAEHPDVFKLEWFNTDNAFQAEYLVSNFVPKAFIKGRFNYQGAAGEAVIFDNQGDDVKLKATVQRLMKFECEVPDYLAEVITLGLDHDQFFINDVAFVSAKKPTVTQLGRSNSYKLEVELKQATVIGLNTHDAGFNCDAANFNNMVLNDTQTGKTTSFTVEAPSEYILHIVTVIWASGTGTIKCGTTAGGAEVFAQEDVSSTDSLLALECNTAFESATTLYFTLTGTVQMTVNLQYILNRER